MLLYRPIDIHELRLVYESGLKAFPARKPDQPIFYPVLNFEYADQIAREWNAKSDSVSGYVSKFTIDDAYASRFKPEQVGAARHTELWIPAEELSTFNQHIAPPIQIVSAHFGPDFKGHIPDLFGLAGKDAKSQFVALARTLDYSGMDFKCEISVNHTAILLNYAFWAQTDFSNHGMANSNQQRILTTIQKIWSSTFPNIPLPHTNEENRDPKT